MRLIAWNCHERLDRKVSHLTDLDFDVAVVTEAGPFDPGLGQTRTLTSTMRLAIERPGHTKHIAVLAQSPWRVVPLPFEGSADHPWVVIARVHGPIDFTVVAFWALGPEWIEDRLPYATQASRVIDQVLPQIEGPVVFAGDFNAPITITGTDQRRHAANVASLADRDLVSAFTTARPHVDPLTKPTLFHQWKADRRFHIDHVFVPRAWTAGMTVQVGTFERWVKTRRSDHVPVIVDLPSIVTTLNRPGESEGSLV